MTLREFVHRKQYTLQNSRHKVPVDVSLGTTRSQASEQDNDPVFQKPLPIVHRQKLVSSICIFAPFWGEIPRGTWQACLQIYLQLYEKVTWDFSRSEVMLELVSIFEAIFVYMNFQPKLCHNKVIMRTCHLFSLTLLLCCTFRWCIQATVGYGKVWTPIWNGESRTVSYKRASSAYTLLHASYKWARTTSNKQ